MPIRANFGEFFGRGDTRFEILSVEIGSAVSSVALFKYYHYVKKLLAEVRKVIFHLYGEKPPVIGMLPNFARGFPSPT